MSKTFIAVSALIGTIIGAGFLGIPYVVMKSGFKFGLIHLIILAFVLCTTMLYLGEICQRTKTNHHLPGYAEKYIGKRGKILMMLASFFGLYAALVAYMIAESKSLSYIIFNNTNNHFYLGILFWLVLSICAYIGIKALEEADSVGIVIIVILVISICVYMWDKIDISNLTYNNLSNFFTPFGVILFSFLGFSVVPEIERIIGKEKKIMKRAIIISYALSFIIYLVFTIVVLGSLGSQTPEIATLALGKPFILLGIVTMLLAYLTLNIALIDTLKFDFKFSKFKSWLITISIPLILYILLVITENADFTKVLGIGGVISGGITGIMILYMIKRAKKQGDAKPAYSIPYSDIFAVILTLFYILGAIIEIINVIK